MKTLTLLLLTAITLSAAQPNTTTIRVATPSWARYKTISSQGWVEFWADKPFVLYLDAIPPLKPRPFCWWALSAENFGPYDIIYSGITNNPSWTRSARRIR